MLLPQIPHEVKKKIATELKLDLKLLSISRKSEAEADLDRYTKLEAIISFIRKYGNLGSVERPDEYFEDTLEMRWGTYGDIFTPPERTFVYFGATTENTIVGLGGSPKHVIGNNVSRSAPSGSIEPYLVSYLIEHLGSNQKETDFPYENAPSGREEYRALEGVSIATAQMEGPKHRLEFLAKRMLYGKCDGQQILLGAPLYVAMRD